MLVHLRRTMPVFLLALAAARPLPADPDLRAWWATTAALSGDAMEGRDTGSPDYARAARLVAARFAATGLKPAGENGGYFQRVPMEELRVMRATVSVGGSKLRFLHDIMANPLRADQWPFLQAGIPATAFVFGYRPGSASERTYRQWYRTGYHRPQDDLAQPIDWQAASDFNRFFYALAARVADEPATPAWKPSSPLKPQAR